MRQPDPLGYAARAVTGRAVSRRTRLSRVTATGSSKLEALGWSGGHSDTIPVVGRPSSVVTLAQNIALTSAASCDRAPDSTFDRSPSIGAVAARQIAPMKSLSGETSGSVTLIGWSVGEFRVS